MQPFKLDGSAAVMTLQRCLTVPSWSIIQTWHDAKKKSWFLISGPELEEQKLLILRKEIQIHCTSDLTHEADQLKLQRCLRDQVTQDWVLVEVASSS